MAPQGTLGDELLIVCAFSVYPFEYSYNRIIFSIIIILAQLNGTLQI